MLKKLWPYARPYRAYILLGVVCSAAEAVFELLIPMVMMLGIVLVLILVPAFLRFLKT